MGEERGTGTNGETTIETIEDNGKRYDPQTGFLIIGQAHGHPESDDANTTTSAEMSTKDRNTATSTGIPIYGVNAMSGKVGDSQSIHRANPNPVKRRNAQTRNVGKTGLLIWDVMHLKFMAKNEIKD